MRDKAKGIGMTRAGSGGIVRPIRTADQASGPASPSSPKGLDPVRPELRQDAGMAVAAPLQVGRAEPGVAAGVVQVIAGGDDPGAARRQFVHQEVIGVRTSCASRSRGFAADREGEARHPLMDRRGGRSRGLMAKAGTSAGEKRRLWGTSWRPRLHVLETVRRSSPRSSPASPSARGCLLHDSQFMSHLRQIKSVCGNYFPISAMIGQPSHRRKGSIRWAERKRSWILADGRGSRDTCGLSPNPVGIIHPDRDRLVGRAGSVSPPSRAWFAGAGPEALPWREDRDPYRILVSEMMLVQTTVAAVVPFFARFLGAVSDRRKPWLRPTKLTCLKVWEGLGLLPEGPPTSGRRAVDNGRPRAGPSLMTPRRSKPCRGSVATSPARSSRSPSTVPRPIVEANTQRVLARWLVWEEDLKSSRSQARLWEAAERMVPQEGAGAFNQAFMELGALICIPRRPRFAWSVRSPSECVSRKLGVQDRICRLASPKVRRPRRSSRRARLSSGRGKFLIVKRGPGRLWEHFWEFPTVHLAGPDPAGRALGEGVDLAEGVWPGSVDGVRVVDRPGGDDHPVRGDQRIG